MTLAEQTKFPSNLLDERYLCVEWAQASGLIDKLAADYPLIRVNRMTVRQYLDRAIGYLIQEGVTLREIWSLAELVDPDAFQKITSSALAHSPASAQCMAFVLLTIAREWLSVDRDHIAKLEAAANRLPGIATDRRRNPGSRHLANARLCRRQAVSVA